MYDPPLPPNLALGLHANTLRFPRQSKLDSQTIYQSQNPNSSKESLSIILTDKHIPL